MRLYPLVDALLEIGEEVNRHDSQGHTPLSCACIFGDVRTVALLLGAGADGNITDHDHRTALHYAVRLARQRQFNFCSTIAPMLREWTHWAKQLYIMQPNGERKVIAAYSWTLAQMWMPEHIVGVRRFIALPSGACKGLSDFCSVEEPMQMPEMAPGGHPCILRCGGMMGTRFCHCC
jgi:Ankyrin repeats (many copies)